MNTSQSTTPNSADARASAGLSHRLLQAQRPLKVVVVDDDEFTLLLYKTRLETWPVRLECSFFSNGVHALEHMATNAPDLLIVDWHMPEMTGSQLVGSLCQLFDMGSTKVVVVSGSELACIQHDQLLGPEVEILPKPIPFERLLVIAQALVGSGLASG